MAASFGDDSRKQKAREYARAKRRTYLVDLSVTVIYILFWLVSGLSLTVRGVLGLPAPLQVAAYLIIFIAGHTVVSFPLSVYSGYILPKRYGLSVQSKGSWLADVMKSFILSVILALVAGEVLYWLLGLSPNFWWLPAGGFYLLFTVVLANLGPVLIVPLFFKLVRLPDQDLANRLQDFAEKAGTRVRGVYKMVMSTKSTAANAALMGLGNTRRIVLTDTLLDRYTPEEIEVVLAHELGHHVNGDIPRSIILESLATMGAFFMSSIVLARAVAFFGFDSVADVAALPLLAIVMGGFMFVLGPAENAYSRMIERAADRYALTMTNAPGAFESLMLKLADQNLSEPNPAKWVVVLFYNHPPYEQRIAMAHKYTTTEGHV